MLSSGLRSLADLYSFKLPDPDPCQEYGPDPGVYLEKLFFDFSS
jgi:hypothetical protein